MHGHDQCLALIFLLLNCTQLAYCANNYKMFTSGVVERGEVSSPNTSARGGHFVLGQLTHGSVGSRLYMWSPFICVDCHGIYISIWSWAVMMMSVCMQVSM